MNRLQLSHIRCIWCVSLLLCVVMQSRPGQAESLVWRSSLEEARASAISQGKLILLVAGRPDCEYCHYMKEVVCEASNVKPIIDEVYVPWYADMDSSTDWQPYASDLGNCSLPIVCMIDPETTNEWLLRITGPYPAGTFEGYLKLAARLYPPKPNNLTSQQVVHDSQYQVTGRIWTNAQPTNVFYRVNLGTSTANPFVSATGATNWIAPLGSYVVAGVSNQYTFDVYAAFANGSHSPTNRLLFSYDPTPGLLGPRFCSIQVANGVVHLTLADLTVGATNQVERCLALEQTNSWSLVTNFVSTASTSEISDGANPSCGRAFYRVFNVP